MKFAVTSAILSVVCAEKQLTQQKGSVSTQFMEVERFVATPIQPISLSFIESIATIGTPLNSFVEDQLLSMEESLQDKIANWKKKDSSSFIEDAKNSLIEQLMSADSPIHSFLEESCSAPSKKNSISAAFLEEEGLKDKFQAWKARRKEKRAARKAKRAAKKAAKKAEKEKKAAAKQAAKEEAAAKKEAELEAAFLEDGEEGLFDKLKEWNEQRKARRAARKAKRAAKKAEKKRLKEEARAAKKAQEEEEKEAAAAAAAAAPATSGVAAPAAVEAEDVDGEVAFMQSETTSEGLKEKFQAWKARRKEKRAARKAKRAAKKAAKKAEKEKKAAAKKAAKEEAAAAAAEEGAFVQVEEPVAVTATPKAKKSSKKSKKSKKATQ